MTSTLINTLVEVTANGADAFDVTGIRVVFRGRIGGVLEAFGREGHVIRSQRLAESHKTWPNP
jgi:hypothetical protein